MTGVGDKLNLSPLQAKALLNRKQTMNDALDLFRPTERQEDFFRTFSLDYILETLLGGGNRSGKSTCAAVAIAALVQNRPITFRDGSKWHMRPVRWQAEGIKVWIVGYDWRHIGKTIFRLLFKKGLFRIIRDQKTGRWRAWNPDAPEDKDCFHITRDAPPLIREADIVGGYDGISWENKKEHQLSSVEFAHDGTRLEFFASTGARPQGDPAHAIWIDEKIEDEGWYSELLFRLADHRGRFLWTTWPTTAPSDMMMQISERAAEQNGKQGQKTFSFVLRGSDNPYTRGEHRDAILETMDEETRAARDEGVISTDRWRIYARFSRYVHRAHGQSADDDDELAKAVRSANGIPADWTRYLILDPGTGNPAVLFVAVPPPKFGHFIVPYDELYRTIHNRPAKEIAEAVKGKTSGQWFEEFIIDAHAARQTPMGFDRTVGENYEKEFAAQNLRCRRRGSRFSFGSDNVQTRIYGLQGAMNIRTDGTPLLRILGCPDLTKQLELAHWGKDPNDNPTEEPAKRQKIDLVQCLEYFVSREDCGYVKPPLEATPNENSFEAVLKSIANVFGKPARKTADRSVFCGSGSP